MLNSLRNLLGRYIHDDYAYLIVCVIYFLGINTPLFVISILYNFVPFFIISLFLFSKMREYTYGFHLHDNIRCFLFTIPQLIIFSYIAKQSTDYLWVVFFICLICTRDLYEKVPIYWEDIQIDKRWYNCKPFNKLKLNRDKMNVEYNYEWHRKRALAWISISYIISILFFTQKMDYLCSCTLWCIIMVDMMLFINKD